MAVYPPRYGGTIDLLAVNPVTKDIFAANHNNGVFRSTDNGEKWVTANDGLANKQIQALVISSKGYIFVGTFRDGIFRSMDNGGSWKPLNLGLTEAMISSLAINSQGHIFAGTNAGVFRSLNNGENWKTITNGLNGLPRSADITSFAFHPLGYFFAGGINNGVFRSNNNGENWVPVNSGLTNTSVSCFAINSNGFIFDRFIHFGSYGHLQ